MCILNFIYKFLSKIVSEGFNVVLLFSIVKYVCIGERKFFGEKRCFMNLGDVVV